VAALVSNAGSRGMGNPSGDLIQEARFVREDHEGSVEATKYEQAQQFSIALPARSVGQRVQSKPRCAGCFLFSLFLFSRKFYHDDRLGDRIVCVFLIVGEHRQL